ncbi:MAG: ATP-binding protein [Rubrobacter sp.]
MKDRIAREDISTLLARLSGIVVFREVLEAGVVKRAIRSLELLEARECNPRRFSEALASLLGELLAEEEPLLEDAWKSCIVAATLDAESVFARKAESGRLTGSGRDQARRDLATLKRLFDLDAGEVVRGILDVHPELEGAWSEGWPRTPIPGNGGARRELALKLAGCGDWSDQVEPLEEYFARNGAGIFGRYRAFRWEHGVLRTVPEPDATAMTDLVGYERERGAVARNTERFSCGLPAQHVLLYGSPGTGKSSTVKAVFNRYSGEGVRLVEVAKERLSELPRLLEELRGRGLRFIVYVDDLSFEESEVEYKSLKALIEGSIESPPENVRVYATSNRRNLIRETFSEREGDDVHARDTMGEKLSLAARFGLRVTFSAPDQKTYLDIVRGIAKERGLSLTGPELETLESDALNRERWGSGRNGRTARQAVDEFEAGTKDNR